MKNKTSDLASNEECRKVWEISDAQATINHGYSLELIDPNCIMRVNSCFVEELTLDDVSLKSQHENICNKDALNCKNTMKLSNIQSVELENAIESAEGKGGKFVMPRSMASPFRSPITPNVANLKVRIEDRVSSKLLKAEEKSIRMLDANVAAASYIKYSSDIDMDNGHMARQKRRSSVAAEIRIKRQIEEDTKASKNDDFVKSPFELMFCGISKPKKLPLKIQSEASIFDIFNIRASILQDRTNSPRKSGVFKHKCISDEDKMLNSRFFLNEDPSIEASRQDCAESVGENQSILEHNDTLSDISEYLPDKNYYKLKETNTKLNEGYTTIEPKRKAIIEISNCPKSFFRKNNRPRRVCFCTDASNVVHNPGGTINPIIEKSATVEPSFEWSGEKQVVEIVKRIDLWPEMSQDDYVCRPIDKKLNLENS